MHWFAPILQSWLRRWSEASRISATRRTGLRKWIDGCDIDLCWDVTCLFIWLFVCVFVSLFVSLFCLFIYFWLCLALFVSYTYMFVSVLVCVCICLFVYPFIFCLCIYLFDCLVFWLCNCLVKLVCCIRFVFFSSCIVCWFVLVVCIIYTYIFFNIVQYTRLFLYTLQKRKNKWNCSYSCFFLLGITLFCLFFSFLFSLLACSFLLFCSAFLHLHSFCLDDRRGSPVKGVILLCNLDSFEFWLSSLIRKGIKNWNFLNAFLASQMMERESVVRRESESEKE